MKIKLINGAQCPKQGREGDAGYDFFLKEDVVLKAHAVTIIDTGVCVELPKGFAGLLAMRSSICRQNLIMQQPLIDENYRGELHGMIYSDNNEDLTFRAGDRLFSLYVFPVYQGQLEVVDELSESNRGTNWSGSSGK